MPLNATCYLALCIAGAVSFLEVHASAVPYEVFVAVVDEQGLYDLRDSGQIAESSFDALLLLIQTQVDLNRADRDRLYALPNLELADVDAILRVRDRLDETPTVEVLVARGALSEQKANAIRPFVLPTDPIDRAPVGGFVRAQVQTTGRNDRHPPAIAVQARVEAIEDIDAAVVVVLTRNSVGGVRWDSFRSGLSVTPEKPRVAFPKFYLAWRRNRWGMVVGTYRVGFGQRLTFDVTDQTLPNGFFGDLEIRRGDSLTLRCRRRLGELVVPTCPTGRAYRVGPDFDWTERLTGVAVGVERLEVGRGSLQVNVWASHQMLGAQAFELVDRSDCPDPRRDDDIRCRPPPAYVRDREGPQATLSGGTLPNVAAESLVGANLTFFPRATTRVGSTAYAAVPRWLVGGVRLGYQESARRPFGGAFGAVGVDFARDFGGQSLFAEVTRSFDSQPAGGDFAVIVRSVSDLGRTEFDASVRYYGPNFANPYARSQSAPDERDGLRTRDELGARVRTASRLGRRTALRTLADVWRGARTGGTRVDLYARIDVAMTTRWSWATWWAYRRSGVQRLSLASRVAFALDRRVRVAAQLVHQWRGLSSRERPRDLGALVDLSAQPAKRLQLRARLRYDDQQVGTRARGADILWGSVRLTAALRGGNRVSVRYDVRGFVDTRASTKERVPNPEHWLWLEYRLRF